MAATPLLGKAINSHLRHHLNTTPPTATAVCSLIRRLCYTTTAAESPPPIRKAPSTTTYDEKPSLHPPKDPKWLWEHDLDNRKWKDVKPKTLVKHILHSDRYMDGEHLTSIDEKMVVEKLLAYHPHSEDKIGCGLASIMVDRHPQFKYPRCLFVVRTDGERIDFSYKKCIRAYNRQ